MTARRLSHNCEACRPPYARSKRFCASTQCFSARWKRAITVFGARDYLMRVWLDPDRLYALGLTTEHT